MGRKKRVIKPLATIWEVSDELWARIEPILLGDAPPPPPAKGGRHEPIGGRSSTGSSSGCERAVSGIACPNSSATTVRSTAGFNGGARTE